jgi:hypothetical protein
MTWGYITENLDMQKLIAIAVACALPTALLAQEAAPAPSAAATPTQAAAEEKPSCRSYRATGSIMPGKRICHTKAEWRVIDAQMSEEARRALGRDRGMGSGPAAN